MSPPEAARRTLLHTRTVTFNGYSRDDGLWDIEGRLRDVRDYDSLGLDDRLIPSAKPVHDMQVCATVDNTLMIRAITCSMAARPLLTCEQTQAPLQSLIGVTMGSGWRREIEARMGGAMGCTHLRELLFSMATAAYQTIPVYQAQLVRKGMRPAAERAQAPRHLGQCMTWDRAGALVQRLHPQYFTGSVADSAEENAISAADRDHADD